MPIQRQPADRGARAAHLAPHRARTRPPRPAARPPPRRKGSTRGAPRARLLSTRGLRERRAGSTAERALELREHALLSAQVVIGHRVRELLVQLALLPPQMTRDDDVDDDAKIATPPAAE